MLGTGKGDELAGGVRRPEISGGIGGAHCESVRESRGRKG